MTRPDTGSAAGDRHAQDYRGSCGGQAISIVPDASTVIVVASTADNPHNDVMRLLRDVLIPDVRREHARSMQLGG